MSEQSEFPSKPPVEIRPPQQEKSEKTTNLLDKLDGIFYRAAVVTKKGKIPYFPLGRLEGVERPLFARARRAELLKKLKSSSAELKLEEGQELTQEDLHRKLTEERRRIVGEAQLVDELLLQYLDQGEVTVDFPNLGPQTSKYIHLVPPETSQTEEAVKKPEIVLIPGLSNDVECVGNLALELALSGRRVRVIGYPDSFNGEMTDKFVDAVEHSDDLSLHTKFFKQAIGEFYKNNEPIELWGYSLGGPIVASLLTDPTLSQKTTDAVLINPASLLDRSVLSGRIGQAGEVGVVREWRSVSKFAYTNDSTTPLTKDEKDKRKRVFNSLIKKGLTRFDDWKNARVREGGSIVTVSCAKDNITQSRKAIGKLRENPQMRVVDIPNGHHITPLYEPENVLPKVFDLQRN